MIAIQNYVRPQTIEEAWRLNQKRQNRILGGMLWLKMSRASVHTAIDLCDLGLNTIEENETLFSIGASVSLRALETHQGLNAYTGDFFKNALQNIVGVQFRNMATVGGSIWGRFGFSDVLTAFLALDSYVELYKGGIIPLEQFTAMPYDRDILVRVLVKKKPGSFRYSSMRNQRTDFPVLCCAVSRTDNGSCAVIGARPGKAVVVRDTASILQTHNTPECISAFADFVSENVPTASNLRGSAEYRTHLIRVLTARTLTELEENTAWK